MAYLEGKINSLQDRIKSHENRIDEIQKICKMENFLKNYKNASYGDSLWIELCSFKRKIFIEMITILGKMLIMQLLPKTLKG